MTVRPRPIGVTLALAFLLAALPAWAQPSPGKTPRIGYLSFRSDPSPLDEAFRQGLRELGYVEGQNITIEYRYAGFSPDRAEALAAELVRLDVDVIVCTRGSVPAQAARKATTTIPIVFESGGPMSSGLVKRLDRPGENLTGIDNFTGELNVKRLDLLKEAVPRLARLAVLVNPSTPGAGARLRDLEEASRALRVRLHAREARQPQQIDQALAGLARERPDALLVLNDPMFFTHRERIVQLALQHRLPGAFQSREFAEAGGLLSYAPSFADIFRRLATYVDRILRGAKPADLPVEQPTRFELVINLRTARILGLTIPPALLLRADHLIE